MTIENYLSDLEDVQDKYNRNWRNPFSSVYANAHERFKQTLDDQRKTNEKAAELMVMFASIGLGGGLGALFGKAVVRNLAVDGALSIVANNNMTRVFNAMAVIEGSPALSFMLGEAWNAAAGEISSAARQRVSGLLNRAPTNTGIRNPTNFHNDVDNFVLDAKNAAYAVGRSVRDSDLSADRKTAIANVLRNAPFFRNAPTRPVIRNTARAEQEIELLMYMVLVMDSDVLVDTSHTRRGDNLMQSSRVVGRVQQSAAAPNYPSETRIVSHGTGVQAGDFTSRSIEYRRPGGNSFIFGSDIMNRANSLHRALFGGDFERGGYGRDEILRAERMSAQIQRSYFRTG